MNKNLSKLFSYLEGLDTKSGQFLMKALESNNMPGFDYIEFKQSLGALKSMAMDEGTAFKSAFATASTMGLTKTKLIDSTVHYKQVLQKEKGQFDVALKTRIEQRVSGKAEENQRLEARLKQVDDQIKRLEDEKVQVKQQIAENEKAKEKESRQLAAQQESFEKTYHLILQEMQNDIDKVGAYL